MLLKFITRFLKKSLVHLGSPHTEQDIDPSLPLRECIVAGIREVPLGEVETLVMSSSWLWEDQMADFRCKHAHSYPAAGRAAVQNSPLGDLSWHHLWTVASRASLASCLIQILC